MPRFYRAVIITYCTTHAPAISGIKCQACQVSTSVALTLRRSSLLAKREYEMRKHEEQRITQYWLVRRYFVMGQDEAKAGQTVLEWIESYYSIHILAIHSETGDMLFRHAMRKKSLPMISTALLQS